MRQVWIPKAGPPEVLELREARDPDPEARRDAHPRRGRRRELRRRDGPAGPLPGSAADARACPATRCRAASTRWATASRATGSAATCSRMTRFGGYADAVCVPEVQVSTRPPGMSAEEGAALPVNYLTAWQLLFVMGSLHAGETMLVHSAGRRRRHRGDPAREARRRAGLRHRVGGQARPPEGARRRRLHRLHARGLRGARARADPRPRRRADPRRRRRRLLQEELPLPRADRAARHVRHLGGRHRQAAGTCCAPSAPRSARSACASSAAPR